MKLLRVKGVIGRFGFGRYCYGTFGKSATAEDEIIDQMLSMKPMPSIAAFNKKLNDYTKSGYHDKAIRSYRKIVGANVKVSESTVSIMMNCFGKIQRMDHGMSLLGLALKSGLIVNDFVITSVLNGMISENKLSEAVLFLDKILDFVKRSPKTIMYNILLKGAYEAKDYTCAVQVFKNMRCEPDTITYTIYISQMLEEKEFKEAYRMLNRLLRDTHLTPDSALFGSVMKRLLDSKSFKDAGMLFQLMVQQDTYFEANLFNVVLDFYAQKGLAKQAEAVISFMVTRSIAPSVITYNTLLLGYCISGKVQSAENLYRLLIKGSLKVSADLVSATTMLKVYCRKTSLLGKGVKFFEKTFGKGPECFAPNAVTYGTLIEALFKVKNPELAQKYLQEMRERDINISQKLYGIILNGFVTNADIESADEYFNQAEYAVFNKDVVVWNILIKGAVLNDRSFLAKSYLDDMFKMGVKPDVKSFTPLLIAFYSCNYTIEAKQVLNLMRRFHIPLKLVLIDLKAAHKKSWLVDQKRRLWNAIKKLETEE